MEKNQYGNKNHVWRTKHSRGIMSQIIRWIGHVQRLARIMLRAEVIGEEEGLEENRKWIDAVEEDLTKLGIQKSTITAMDRSRWERIIEPIHRPKRPLVLINIIYLRQFPRTCRIPFQNLFYFSGMWNLIKVYISLLSRSPWIVGFHKYVGWTYNRWTHWIVLQI